MTAILSESNQLNTIMGHAHCIHTYIRTYVRVVCLSVLETLAVSADNCEFPTLNLSHYVSSISYRTNA